MGYYLVLSCCLLIGLSQATPAKPLTATEVVQQGEKKMRGTSSYTRAAITIEKTRFKRTMVVDSWEKQQEKSFIRILRPKKDKGVTFLKLDQNLWQYIPKIGKEIKIEASLMHDSWMGSDFTNDDLVRTSSVIDDYEHSFLDAVDSNQYKILFKPKPGAPVVWGRIISSISKKDFLPRRNEYYDHKNRLKKVMTLSDFKTMGGRFIPTRLEMATVSKGRVRSKTTMKYLKARFNLSIPGRTFSKANLRR